MSEAEARRKEKPQELATKKMQAVTEEIREPEPVMAVDDFKIDYRAAARDALNSVQQELVTKEIEQKVKLELENEKIQERLNAFVASEVEETKAPSILSMKLNVITGKTFGMVPQGSKIQSIISVAGHHVIRNLKRRRIGHDTMIEQDAVHIEYEADVTAHLLDTNGKKIGVTGLLDTGAVVSVMPIKTWERMGFKREDLIPTNLRLAAANGGAIYVA